jgi:methionine-rich copper-binding protein CopC
MFNIKFYISLCSLALAVAAPLCSWAHAFPDHAEPQVGAVITISPAFVRIWFDGVLEPLFSTLHVRNTSGQQVDRGDGHVDESDKTLLEGSLPNLPPGTYRVFWSVVARDGHRTQGDYTFTLH